VQCVKTGTPPKASGFYYLNKKRAMALLKHLGYQLPNVLRTHNSNIIIRSISENVKREIDTVLKSNDTVLKSNLLI